MPTTIDPGIIRSEEGAIGMLIKPGADDLTFNVECVSFEPPWVQPGEIAGQVLMTQVVAPARPNAGTYTATVKFNGSGENVIICFNGTTRARIRVFAGDFPVWDPVKVALNTQAGRNAGRIADTVATMRVTGRLNG